jgi:hypothetical protein
MKTINTNDTLQIRFVTDADLKPTCTVIERKGNFATLQLSSTEIVKRKVHKSLNEEYEYVYPYGIYSMAPIAKSINN